MQGPVPRQEEDTVLRAEQPKHGNSYYTVQGRRQAVRREFPRRSDHN